MKQQKSRDKSSGDKSTKKKKSRNFKDKEDRFEKNTTDEYKSTNDPRWYAQYPELITSAGTYTFSNPVGIPFLFGSGSNSTATGITPSMAIPGLFAIHVLPFCGYANNAQDPYNVQMRRLYTYMRKMRSGSASYDPPDVGMYLMAVANAYNFYFFAKRLVGAVNTASAVNRYQPQDLVSAMNGNYTDLHQNQGNLVAYLQNYVLKLSTLFIPQGMTFLERWSTIFSNVYNDKDSPRGQFYFYMPTAFGVYNEKSETSGSYIEYSINNGPTVTKWTYSSLVQAGDTILNALLYSQDINQISVDLFNAYGGNVYTVATIPMGYTIVPVHDLEMLNQIQNSYAYGRTTTINTDADPTGSTINVIAENFMITQDINGNNIVSMPVAGISKLASAEDDICNSLLLSNVYRVPLTVSGGFTSPEYIMTSTRLMARSTRPGTYTLASTSPHADDWSSVYPLDVMGTELPTLYAIYQRKGSTQFNSSLIRTITITGILGQGNSSITPAWDDQVQELVYKLCVTHTFDFCPAQWVCLPANTSGSSLAVKGLSLNYDYVTLLDAVELKKLHTAALMSEFYVPGE